MIRGWLYFIPHTPFPILPLHGAAANFLPHGHARHLASFSKAQATVVHGSALTLQRTLRGYSANLRDGLPFNSCTCCVLHGVVVVVVVVVVETAKPKEENEGAEECACAFPFPFKQLQKK